MTIFCILIAFAIERILWNPDPYRKFRWLDKYFLWTQKQHWLKAWSADRYAMLLPLVPVILVAAWLQALFYDDWSNLLSLMFGTAALLFSLGPRDLPRQTEEYLYATGKKPGESQAIAEDLCTELVDEQESRQAIAVARCVLVQANQRMFAPLFWFILLGPAGAMLYRAARQLRVWFTESGGEQAKAEDAGTLDGAIAIADWLPARFTVLSYAIAGNFDAITQIWKDPVSANQLLSDAGVAALSSFPTDSEIDDLGGTPPVVDDALALILRALSLWLIVLALVGIVVWLA